MNHLLLIIFLYNHILYHLLYVKGKVYMYYGLTNYYQNHRRYVKSRDDDQLLGRLSTTPSSDCIPFAYTTENKPIAPCGAIANSLFNGMN